MANENQSVRSALNALFTSVQWDENLKPEFTPMASTQHPFAIANDLQVTGLTVFARCEMRTYDVWGNARDGWDVNDSYSHGTIVVPCDVRVHGVPRFPGASDHIRSFPGGTGSLRAPDALFSYYPSDKGIREAFGVKCRFETDGDDLHIQVTRERDGYPIGELQIIEFTDSDD